ncbi:MAG: translation initiation factor IF-2 N-terminal domain-containing protein [Nitrospinota bacterium]
MKTIRIYKAAKQLKISTTKLISLLTKIGIKEKTAIHSITESELEKVRALIAKSAKPSPSIQRPDLVMVKPATPKTKSAVVDHNEAEVIRLKSVEKDLAKEKKDPKKKDVKVNKNLTASKESFSKTISNAPISKLPIGLSSIALIVALIAFGWLVKLNSNVSTILTQTSNTEAIVSNIESATDTNKSAIARLSTTIEANNKSLLNSRLQNEAVTLNSLAPLIEDKAIAERVRSLSASLTKLVETL